MGLYMDYIGDSYKPKIFSSWEAMLKRSRPEKTQTPYVPGASAARPREQRKNPWKIYQYLPVGSG